MSLFAASGMLAPQGKQKCSQCTGMNGAIPNSHVEEVQRAAPVGMVHPNLSSQASNIAGAADQPGVVAVGGPRAAAGARGADGLAGCAPGQQPHRRHAAVHRRRHLLLRRCAVMLPRICQQGMAVTMLRDIQQSAAACGDTRRGQRQQHRFLHSCAARTRPEHAQAAMCCAGEDYPCGGRLLLFEVTRDEGAQPGQEKWKLVKKYVRCGAGTLLSV